MTTSDIKFDDWTLKDSQTGNTLSLHLWDGRYMVFVRGADRTQKGFLFSKRYDAYQAAFIRKTIAKMVQASPETKVSIKFTVFDKMAKQQKLDWVMTIEKDAKQCFRIHLTDVGTNQTFIFPVRGPNNISVGSDVLNENDRSTAKLYDMIEWMELAKNWVRLMKLPFDPSKQRGGGNWKGGNGGGGNWNRGGGGGGYGGNRGGYNGGGQGGGGGAPAPAAGGGADEGDTLPF